MTILNFPPTAGEATDGSFTYENNGVLYSWDGYKWEANSESAFDDKYVNIDGDTMTGDLTVPNLISEGDVQTTSLNGGHLGGFRNQIINGDYRVWQRGQGPFSTSVPSSSIYSADRWYVSTNRIALEKYSNSADMPPGFTSSIKAISAGNFSCAQGVELYPQGTNAQFVKGSTWTLSFWARGDDSGTDVQVIGQFADTINGSGSVEIFDVTGEDSLRAENPWKRLSYTFTIDKDASATNIGFFAYIRASTTTKKFQITGVQLEPGPVATPFEHRPIGTELALCQRYYISVNLPSGVYHYICQGMMDNSNQASGIYQLPTPMRSDPTFNSIGGIAVRGFSGGSVDIKDINDLSSTSPQNGLSLRLITQGTTFDLGSPCQIVFKNDGIDKNLIFDAEL